jgi:hypothetical protein
MLRRFVRPSLVPAALGAGLLVALAALGAFGALGLEGTASANGRPPATASIAFRQGHESDIVAGLTFGTAISHDGGATWHWVCEEVLGLPLNNPYDPIFTYTPAGSVFATRTNGMIVMRDGCTYDPAASGPKFVSATALGPDGAFYYAVTDPTGNAATSDFQIYKSTDDGVTFPQHRQPDPATDTNVFWQSIAVAPSSAGIVYVSGYRYIPDGAGTKRDHLVYRSEDGGASWAPAMPPTISGLTLMQNSLIYIVAIARDNPMHVYARVAYIDNTTTDALYVSTNGGATWTEIHRQPDRFLGFVVHAALHEGHHDLVTTTTKFGTEIAHGDGAPFQPLAGAPHTNCLTENSSGELWACTQNYGLGQQASDDAGIMKTTDLSTWTKVLRYQDLVGPVTGCGADTIQEKTCNQSKKWCDNCKQLMCTPAPPLVCLSEGPPVVMTRAGCCDAGASPGGPLALALSVATLLWRPRRRLAPR